MFYRSEWSIRWLSRKIFSERVSVHWGCGGRWRGDVDSVEGHQDYVSTVGPYREVVIGPSMKQRAYTI